MFADDTTIPLPALYIDSTDPAVTYTDGRVKAGRLWLDTSTGAIGTLKKRNAGNTGWDTLIDLDAPAVPDDSVTNAKLSNMAQATIKGRASGAGTGDPTDLSAAQVKTLLAIASGDITDFAEAVQDVAGALIVDSATIDFTYNDATGEVTGVVIGAAPSGTAGGGLSGNYPNPDVKVSICIACSDETTALTSGTAKVTFRMPHAMTLTAVRASLTTGQTSGSIFTVDINEGGSTILSTKITIDNGEKTSTTAATPPVISDANLADDAEITIDIDQIGDGTAKGLKVYLIGTRS